MYKVAIMYIVFTKNMIVEKGALDICRNFFLMPICQDFYLIMPV